jgi:hypothetical protein
MSFVIVNYCPHCGAPIWIDATSLHLGLLPKTLFSCGCSPQKNNSGRDGPYVVGDQPQKLEVEITHTGSTSPKNILHG